MDDNEMEEFKEIRESVVAKFPIKSFGKKSEKIRTLYPDTKLLVFNTEPWKLTGTQAVAVNEKLTYTLGKW